MKLHKISEPEIQSDWKKWYVYNGKSYTISTLRNDCDLSFKDFFNLIEALVSNSYEV